MTSAARPLPPDAPPPVPIHGLHHFAWRSRDAEETRHFYEDLLGLPLFHIIQSERVPSTGEYCPYTHFFFRLADGSFVAFFDLGDDTAAAPSPNTPAWVNHLALRVGSVVELERAKARLEAAGVAVLGIVDHHIFKSLYVFDPNGIRLELCAQTADEARMQAESDGVHERLAAWTARKRQWRIDRDAGRAGARLAPEHNDRPDLGRTHPVD